MGSKTVKIQVPTFVKWAGGKTQLIAQYKPFFPTSEDFQRYFEPFLGSGAVYFYLRGKLEREGVAKDKEFILSDINSVLINGFRVVKEKVEELIKELRKHKQKHSEKYYYEIRENFNTQITSEEPDVKNAAEFIYLNKTCYNGLYRVNSQGKFNVPIGRYKKPSILQESKLRRASKLLQGATLKVGSYDEILKKAEKGDFIYLDPPYQPLSPTSNFTSYTKDSFSEDDQRTLSKVFNELAKKKCYLMLSNSYTPLIEGLYNGYYMEKVHAKRMISCKGKGRGAIKEVLILHDPTGKKIKDMELQKSLI